MATGKTILTILVATLFVGAAVLLVYQYRTGSLSQSPLQMGTNIELPVEARLPRANGTLKEYSFSQLQMAMQMRITVWCDSQDHAETACKIAFDRAAELVNVFSDYDSQSETRQLARTEPGIPVRVSDPLFRVLTFSKTLYETSNGAFDPTASPVIRLWRNSRKLGTVPQSNEIEKALQHVGFDKFQMDLSRKTVTLVDHEMNFDFGGIAKGYIGDQVITALRENGIEIGCYEAGGDFVLSNPPPGTPGWIIDIGQNDDGTPQTLELNNCGVSTSGDSQQFVEFEGKRYSHVIDPRTGMGVTTARTAFVIAPSGMQSDALATVGCVLSEAEFQDVLGHYKKTVGWSTKTSPAQ